MRHVTALLSIALLTLGSACSGQDLACEVSDDCYPDEVCYENLCRPRAAVSLDAGTDATSAKGDGGHVEQTSDATSAQTDGGDQNTMPPDMTMSLEDGGQTDDGGDSTSNTCIVDPFEVSCTDPDDDEQFGQYFAQDTAGCPVKSSFKSLDATRSAQLCAVESRDFFRQLFGPCSDRSIRLEAILEPKVPCDPSLIDFDIEVIGKTCESEDVTCETLSDGRKRISTTIPATSSPSIESILLFISANSDDVQFDYDLHLKLY